MFRRLMASSPRELGKYCAFALILFAPGSFVVLPVMWVVRLLAVQAARPGGIVGRRATVSPRVMGQA